MSRQRAAAVWAIAGLAATAALIAAGSAAVPAADAASAAPATSWMVKGQDYLAWDPSSVVNGKDVSYPSIGLLECSQGTAPCPAAQDITLPSFTWRLCGRWGTHVYGFSDDTQCTAQANRTLVFEDYFRLQDAINDGMFPALKMDTALFDLEPWPYSHKESEHPRYWIKRALTLAQEHGIKLMITLGGSLNRCYSCLATAASHGAYKVSVQSQAAVTLTGFEQRVQAALQAVGSKSLLIVGLGTNTPGVHKLWLLRAEYAWATSAGLSQFWLNADNWEGRNVCNSSQGGRGCPEIGVQFLASP